MVSELQAKAEKLRERLLDLSGKNSFIRYNHTTGGKNPNKQRFLRIVNEIPELLIQKLRRGSRYQLKAKPNEANFDFNLPFINTKTGALLKKNTKSIQLYEDAKKFEISCNAIRQDSNSYEKDKGINVLYVAIGFLKYPPFRGLVSTSKPKNPNKKTRTPPTEAFAPLILYPVKLTREKTASGFNYFLETSEEELILNRSLSTKLTKEEGITLPELKYQDEDSPLIERYFKEINLALEEKNEIGKPKKWELKRWATLGIFKFGKLAIYEDTNFESWSRNPLLEKQLVQDFINGVPSNSVEDIGDMDIYQDEFEKIQLVDQIPKLIAEADSTQYKVIVKALEGKSMAIQGPPGTGKSQTITNIIGGLLVRNKKVLFAADKYTALEVVKQRLTDKNLGQYILELHNPSKSKKEFHEGLSSRLAKPKVRFFSDHYDDDFRKLKNLRKELNEHVNAINQKLDLDGSNSTVFELIWRDVLNKINLGKNSNFGVIQEFEDNFLKDLLKNINKENISIIKSNLDLLSELSDSSKNDEFLELSKLKGIPETGDDLSKLIRLSNNLFSTLEDFQKDLKTEKIIYSFLLNLNKENVENDIKSFEELISEKFINKEFTIKEDISEKLANIYKLVVERESQENYIEEWAKPFLENQNKFDLFENCLKEIENIEPKDKNYKIKDLLNDLTELYKTISSFIRDIPNEKRRITSKLTLLNLIDGAESYKKFSENYYDLFGDSLLLLKGSKDVDSLEELIKQIKQIQKNNLDGEKIQKNGLDLSKVRDLGAEKLREFTEIIRNSSFLGCLVDKEVKYAKSYWKKIALPGFKKPSLKQMAKIYLLASNYCQNISDEEKFAFKGFEISDLRDLSNRIKFDDNLENILIDIKSKFLEIDFFEVIYKVFDANEIYNNIEIPYFDKLLNKNFIEIQELTNSYATNIFSKLKLLGEEPSSNILDTSFSNISLILDDLKSLKIIINNLGITINESNIYCEKNLEYTVSSNDINHLLELFGNIDISEYIQLTSKKIEGFSLKELLSFLKGINKLINDLYSISANFEDNILNFYLEENLEDVDYLNDLGKLSESLDYLIKLESDLESFIEFNRLRKNISNLGLRGGIDQLLDIANKTKIKVSDIFEYLYVRNQIKDINLDKKLNKFSGQALNVCKDQFCELDVNFIKDTSNYVDQYLHRSSVKREESFGNSRSPKNLREGDLIEHEINKKRNHLPYRKLFDQALISLQRVKPCFMLSPSSASQCLPKKIDIFDVLIIDEASQMNPEEAIGLIARCKQVIIVGDEKQLPPDNRWMSRDDDDDDDDYAETVEFESSESILELANKVLRNSRECSLGWHYRSRHHSLINFSNRSFYDNRLTVFPSNKIGSEIHLIKVEDPYYNESKNLPEVKTVMETLKSQILDDPTKTILIASTNRAQAGLIQDELDRLRNKDKVINDYISSHKGELDKLLVMNLETVQGEERDVVIISTVYGPDANGVVANRFGDLVRSGGERRLNVLLTRAKEKVYLVTSLNSGDIRVSPGAVTGKRYLKDYLSFAETGIISDTLVRESGEPENDFERAIMNAIKQRGYEVDAQIGCLNYRIDLAIKDPRDTSRYLLAVECDGATYHSGYSARVHDRLRQQVLEGLGWNVFRIWSSDWWRAPEQKLELLDETIEELLSNTEKEESLEINQIDNLES